MYLLPYGQVQYKTFFHPEEKLPSFRQSLEIVHNSLQFEFPHSFIIRILSI